MKKRISNLFTGILFALSVLVLGACSADEEVLFVESSETGLSGESSETLAPAMEKTDDGLLSAKEEDDTETIRFSEEEKLTVHICGAVRLPGVYELEEGSRVMDAVLAAGGFSDMADEEYVNLATILTDGNKVRIPTKDEVAEMSVDDGRINDNGVISPESLEKPGTQDKVNINTADAEELCSLPGIGQTRADSILAYRKEHGLFSKIEDIMQISGIKESSFQKIKDMITVK